MAWLSKSFKNFAAAFLNRFFGLKVMELSALRFKKARARAASADATASLFSLGSPSLFGMKAATTFGL